MLAVRFFVIFGLGLGLIFGLGGDAIPLSKAQGSAEARGEQAYRLGRYQEAVDIWQKAAKAGDAGSAWRMAQEYLDGIFLPRDIDEAHKFLDIAAAKGDARAESELATLYDSGVGVWRNKRKAAELYLRAANKGFGAAQFNIAVMYETGDGVRRNLIEAYKFFLLSAERGFAPFATAAMVNLEARMSRSDITQAQKAAEDFVPQF